MIHINRGDCGHEMLTDAEFQMRYPEAYANMNQETPFASVGRLLRMSRCDADISLREMAKALGLSGTDYSDIERGRVDIPDKMITRFYQVISDKRGAI